MDVRGRGRRDLRLQLLALYLLFVIPVFVLVLLFYISASQRLRDDVAAADLSLARAIALETDDMLLKARDAVETFAQMPAVVQADLVGMEEIFAAGSAARQDINLFYRLSSAGTMLYHFPTSPRTTVGQDFSFRDYFQAARHSQEHVFSKGRVSPTTGRPVVTSVMPVFADDHFDGVVATNLELQRLTETVRRIGLKLPQSTGLNIIIVDATGQIIAHSEPDYLLQDVTKTLPGLEEVLASREGSLISRDRWGSEWLYTYTPIPSAGWGVMVQRPTRLAFASLDSFQRGLILALFLFSLGALFFWAILSGRVIRPLEKLTQYGEVVGRETVEAELKRETILPISQRRDQIGRLTQTLLRTERDIRQRLIELTTLNKTSAAVASTLDTNQVINTILDEVQQLVRVRLCALFVLIEPSQRLQMWSSRGLSQEYPTEVDLTEAFRKLPVYQAIITGQPVQVPDIETDADFSPLLSVARTEGYRSLLVVPLAAVHVPPAALANYRTDVHFFEQQEIDLAASFANHAAMALEHATLFSLTDAELQKRVRFLSALNRVGHTVSQSLLIDDILSNAMDTVFEVMPADACWIYLQRETENFLRLRAQRGLLPSLSEQLRDRRVEFGQGITGHIAETGQPQLFDEEKILQHQWAADPITASGIWRSLLAVPLLAQDSVIGVLGLAAQLDGAFTGAELELLQAIGDQITIAVVNGRLYRRSREVATLEERNRVAREIHDTLAQGFTGILIQLQAAERLSLKRPDRALQSLQEARELARESLQEARRSVLNLRPTILEDLTLDQAIIQQLHRFETQTGLKTDFALEGYPSPLQPYIEQNLYRITQEAVTNVGRHARASRVSITLTFQPKSVSLTIVDNGIGLNGIGSLEDGRAGLSDNNKERFGIVGIKERVGLMRGKVIFETPVSGGTKIIAVIPK